MATPGPVPDGEVVVRATRSSGPGGQHANTSDTRVEVHWDVRRSEGLTETERELLVRRLGPVVRAVSEDSRSQARNREIALERLQAKVAAALVVPATRRPTRPGRGAVERRLAAKRLRSKRKRERRGDLGPADG